MKRNYKTLALAVLLAGSSLGSAALFAKEWERIPANPRGGVLNEARKAALTGETVVEESDFVAVRKPVMMTAAEQSNRRAEQRKAGDNEFSRIARASRAAADCKGNIYGVVNSWNGMASTEESYRKTCWGKLNFATGSVDPIYSNIAFNNYLDPEHQTGAVRDGILYIPEGTRSTVRDVQVNWKRIDLETGMVLEPLDFKDETDYWLASMCYDPITDKFYGMGVNNSNSNLTYNRIVSIDPNDDYLVEILADYTPAAGEYLYGIFYNPADQQIYSMVDNSSLVTIDRETGELSSVVDQVYSDDEPINEILSSSFDTLGTAQVVYSPKDQCIFMVAKCSSDQKVYLIAITLDGDARQICTLDNGSQLVGLYCPDPYAELDAPDQPEITDFSIEGPALNGSVTYTAPTLLYSGIKLEENVKATLKIDGKTIDERTLAPGQSATVSFETTEGQHEMSIRCDLDKYDGPELIRMFYTGNDNPVAPSDVKLNGNVISWTAPGAKGLHGGYVDTSALTYDVFLNEKQINSQPVTETSFTFPLPEELSLSNIYVVAKANGKESQPSDLLIAIVGQSVSLPYGATPTQEESMVYTYIDANGDGQTFGYDADMRQFVFVYENYQSSDDWLILPRIHFDDPSKMYQFSFTFQNYTPYYGTEDLKVYLLKDFNALNDRKEIFRIDKLSLGNDDGATLDVDVTFSVEEAGDYYLAIYANTQGAGSGMRIYNLYVNEKSETTEVPGAITDLVVEAAPLGELKAIATFKAPLVDAGGKALPSNEELTFTMQTIGQFDEHTNIATGRPGEAVTMSCEGENGFNSFIITSSSNKGTGLSTAARKYIGIDTPNLVTNIVGTTSEDNRSMMITWDPVTTGVNGGFIDPDNMTYQVFYQTGAVNWAAVSEPMKELGCIFDPNIPDLGRWTLTVMASNSAGMLKSYSVNSVADQLGVPATLPVYEPFSLNGVNYRWYYDRMTPETENSSIRQILNDDLPSYNVGDCKFSDTSGRLISSLVYGQAVEADMWIPKFSTVGMKKPVFSMKIWNYENAPRFEIRARKYGEQEYETIASVSPDPTSYGTWNEFTLPLPEKYLNQQWVDMRAHFYLPAAGNAYGIIDEINIYESVDHDFKITALTAEKEESEVGTSCEFMVSAMNSGMETGNATIRLSLMANGDQIYHEDVAIRNRRPYTTYQRAFSFPAKVEYMKYDDLKLVATVISEGDEIESNDSMEIGWKVVKPHTPIVDDLSAKWSDDHKSATLTWSMPDMAFGNLEDAEYLPKFACGEEIGPWLNIDKDKWPVYSISSAYDETNWPHYGEPKAWQVINAKDLGTMEDIHMGPHSGEQFFLALSGYDPDHFGETQVKVSDWLISPEVKGGTTVGFWMNELRADYQETIHCMYSSTDRELDSFKKIRNWSIYSATGWEYVEFELPEDAKYFALEYAGWDTLGVCVDDITYVPMELSEWELKHFQILERDANNEFQLIGTSETNSFVHENLNDENHTYAVHPIVSVNGIWVLAPRSNVCNLYSTAVDDLKLLEGVDAGVGSINVYGHNGKQLALYSADGKLMKVMRLASDAQTIPCEAGVVIVKIDNSMAKVMVK